MEAPIPFNTHQAPRFPVNVLPWIVRRYVETLARALQVPPDMVAMLVLAVIAAACAKHFKIRAAPTWFEPVNIYVLVVLAPGNRKSAAFNRVTAPLQAFEEHEAHRIKSEIATQQSRRKIKEQELTLLQQQAANARPEDRDRLLAEADTLAGELAAMKPLVVPQLLVDDVTSERLGQLLAEHGGRMALMSAEGGSFENFTGRYSSGVPNIDVLLKGHAGDLHRVDRIGRPPDLVPSPALTVAQTVQSDVLQGLAAKPSLRGRGLLARYCYAIPESLVGRRNPNPPPMDETVQAQYDDLVRELLRFSPALDDAGEPCPYILELDLEAEAALEEFKAHLEPRLGEFGNLGPIADWGAKLAGTVARIAALLHMADLNYYLDDPWAIPISGETMEAAIAIGHYLIGHAQVAFDLMGADPVLEDARYLVRFLEQRQPVRFSERDLQQWTKDRFKLKQRFVPALQLLIEHRYIFELPVIVQTGPGRPASPLYEVNPALLGLATASTVDPDLDSEDCEDYEEVLNPTPHFEDCEDSEVVF